MKYMVVIKIFNNYSQIQRNKNNFPLFSSLNGFCQALMIALYACLVRDSFSTFRKFNN